MWKAFWLEQRDLPQGSGFRLWGTEHVLAMLLITALIVAGAVLFRRQQERRRERILRVIALLLPALEILKITMLAVSGRMDIGHLPLHLCSMAIYLYPVAALTGRRCVRESLTEIGMITLLPAAVAAILFPDWTMYPVCNFYSLHAFVWHALQVLFPILCLQHGWCRPTIRHLWKNTLFSVVGGTIVGFFDHVTGCNYWFLLRPVPDTPLQILYDLDGATAYPFLLLLTATSINLMMYGILRIFRGDRRPTEPRG